MSDDNEDLKLRDKFAIDILKVILSADTNTLLADFTEVFDDKEEEARLRIYTRKLDRRIRAAYKIADMMRKVRMSTFE